MKTGKLFVALNIALSALPLFAKQAATTTTQTDESAALNQASFKSMEGSWLNMPVSCKARGFFAEPTTLLNEVANLEAQDVFAAFDREAV
ncbi:hypothetical protein K2X33_07470 [bacterium]|nr:hypothetical protein [bacterium]